MNTCTHAPPEKGKRNKKNKTEQTKPTNSKEKLK
jgi:hypothetical protein